MAYFSKRKVEESVKEDTLVWECQGKECKGWMRQNFSLETQPLCPLCGETMQFGMRNLPVVAKYGKYSAFR